MSPDPYDGSYDFSNPQSFNRYSYVLNNPLSFTHPLGLDGGGGGGFACVSAVAQGGANPASDGWCAVAAIFDWKFFESIFGGPSFHGTLKPRPNAQPWDEYNIHYGPNIAGALGLPDAGCDFGACGGGPSALGPPGNGQNQNIPTYSYQPLSPLLPLQLGNASLTASKPTPPPVRKTGSAWWKAYGTQLACELGEAVTGDNLEALLGGTIATSVWAANGVVPAARVIFGTGGSAAVIGTALNIRAGCVKAIWGPGYH